MPRIDTGPGSTFRFVVGLVAAALAIIALAVALVMGNLRAEVNARRERLHRAGVPLALSELTPSPVPDDQNAAPLYQKAFNRLQVQRVDITALRSFIAPNTRKPVRAEVERWVSDNDGVFGLLEDAARRPYCRFPVDWQAPNPLELPILHTRVMAVCSHFLHARAIMVLEDGRYSDAVADCRTALAMSSHVAQDPLMPSLSMACSIRASTFDVLRQVMERAQLDPATRRALFNELAKPDDRRLYAKAAAAQSISATWCFDAAGSHSGNLREYLASGTFSSGPRPWAPLVALYLSPLGRPIRLREEVEYLDRLERGLAFAELPYREAAPRYRKIMDEIAGAPGYCLLTRLSGDLYFRDQDPLWREQSFAEQGATQVPLALEAYRAEHGGYPDSLDDARAPRKVGAGASPTSSVVWAEDEPLPYELPEDPFSGKPFGYRREGRGFVIYSWGGDLDDDVGRELDYATTTYYWKPPNGDLVWRFWN